ncbi:hypothetical protein QQS21_000699 [Conoideocrella luteorostrata]|uniref:Inosine/uridine-preferring nucleoside hydrolase domain-containing protein n=1 Tax=Conoideocrella luteorostrata TaxID=1105319 RepID=A0AAJ0CYN1_9HYPO|nr:hypothetical protein QQS21_000699 [Conoideocrella luteorostrata]
MAHKNRIIIDTDPGVDDVLALLLAFSASSEEIEVALISVTFGNVPVKSCLKNVLGLFRVIDAEIRWRTAQGRPTGFSSLLASKPAIAQGANHPLEEEVLAADHFHGEDGLHGVHEAVPHLSPADTWLEDFQMGLNNTSELFSVSKAPAHREILRVLRENPAGTITIAAVGPLTNIALAASEEPDTFLKVKELVVMGGAVGVPGNITPVAEFNTYADAVAAARVYALTSPNPQSTLPPSSLPAYPPKLLRKLELKLFPLDLTSPHRLSRPLYEERARPLVEAKSPLAQWMAHFMSRTFDKINSLKPTGNTSEPSLQLHDPLVLWYILTSEDNRWQHTARGEDLRVEASGQWSRGLLISDARGMKKEFDQDDDELVLDELPGDKDGWFTPGRGNRVTRMLGSPGEALFEKVLLDSIFPCS